MEAGMNNDEKSDEFETKSITDSMRAEGKAMVAVADALEGIDREQAIRILQATGILLGVPLDVLGLKPR
jgi:hypothetical protein